MTLAIIVHGGASYVPPEKTNLKQAGCLRALQAGWSLLKQGGNAPGAVEAAVRVLEEDENFNAGFGSMLQPDGVVRMDAGMMEGRDLQAGAVAGLEGVLHPISVALRVLREPQVLIFGSHARDFARRHEVELCTPASLISEEQLQHWQSQFQCEVPAAACHDTVGCVALDGNGLLACGVSTGGTGGGVPGRVGDSPCVGAGFYADNEVGAVALTGDGETILRTTQASTILRFLRGGSTPDQAVRQALQVLERRVRGEAGAILMDPEGRIGWDHNASHMPVAYQRTSMPAPLVFIGKQAEREGRSFHGGG